MKWKFAHDRPIYAQIIEQIEQRILAGVYPPGSSMPSVRTLALEAKVNPNTMQKALAELETKGLLQAQKTAGRTVMLDQAKVDELKRGQAEELARQYFCAMQSLGFTHDEAKLLIGGDD